MTDHQPVSGMMPDWTHIPGLLQSNDSTTVESGQYSPHGRKVVQIQALLINVSSVVDNVR